jgi:uncharacterized protein DUF4388
VTRRRPYELQGDLAAFSPPLLFQMMALGRASGLLLLRSPDGGCEVFFQEGKLVFARDAERRETLGEELVRHGLLQKADCEAAARERDRHPGGPRIGAILVQRGKISRTDLEDLIRDRIKDAIYRVIDWRRGRFTFEAGLAPEAEDILLDVSLESLLLECLTRLDEVRRDAAPEGRG